jgi:hypothetical protein
VNDKKETYTPNEHEQQYSRHHCRCVLDKVKRQQRAKKKVRNPQCLGVTNSRAVKSETPTALDVRLHIRYCCYQYTSIRYRKLIHGRMYVIYRSTNALVEI